METLGTTRIEWGIDLDTMSVTRSIGGGEKGKPVKLKGRCQRCWGGLIARSDDSHIWTGIKCRVCGQKLEGKAVEAELERMWQEEMHNWINLEFGRNPNYGEGIFVWKVFPNVELQPQAEITRQVRAKRAEGNKSGKLTRNSFPVGSAGLLFLQAKLLISGVEDKVNQQEWSIVDFPDFDVKDDGTIVTHVSLEGISDDPQYREYKLARKIGNAMIEAMSSAFACELAMKAICLTCKNEAIKDHDLMDLYNDLPELSQRRIEADYTDIKSVLQDGRQVFGTWRYFERNVGPEGLEALIDVPRAQKIGKAARVILDEGEIVGLGGTVQVDAKQNVQAIGERRVYRQNLQVKVKGGEAPPKTEK